MAVGALAWPELGQAETTTLAVEGRATSVSAYEDRVVWSSYRPEGDRYQLMTHSAGLTSTVPIRARARVPFDVDLGRDARGRTVASYSRCRLDSPLEGSLPNYSLGRGCRLYIYAFATGKETRLRTTGTESGFLPTVWGTRFAYFRTSRSTTPPRLVLASTSSARGGEVLRAGTKRPAARPTGLDLRGRDLAFTWEFFADGCYRGDTSDYERFGARHSELWLLQLPRRRTRAEHVCTGDSAILFESPSLAADGVHYFSRGNPGPLNPEPGPHFRRFGPRTASYGDAPAPEFLLSSARAGGTTFYVHAVYEGENENRRISSYRVIRSDDLAFRPSARSESGTRCGGC